MWRASSSVTPVSGIAVRSDTARGFLIQRIRRGKDIDALLELDLADDFRPR